MTEFVASNGVVVETKDGMLRVAIDGNVPATWASARATVALREFFLAERDDQLGRWRWSENPDYVVYDDPVDIHRGLFGSDIDIVIVCESDGVAKGYCRADDAGGEPAYWRVEFILAARAYFDAHPAPKPWHDAKPGEFWLINLHGQERVVRVDKPMYDDRPAVFMPVDRMGQTWVVIDGPHVTAGRRLWPPEATS